MPRMILLPGLGADARLLAPQQAAFPGIVVPAWQEPRANESLPSYAARLATRFSPGPDDIIGGVSFGGMLALEIARHYPVRAVIIIASCRHPRAIAPMTRRFARVGLKFPLPGAASRLAPLAVGALGPMGEADRRVILDMAEAVPFSFIRWGARAILDWQGCESLTFPVLHIHGKRDRIILCRAVGPDIAIEGAGHVVNLTHADKVNAAIGTFVNDLAAPLAPARTGSAHP
jgi:pimeloyl-ACP methyl ester carboxylesterase